MITSLIQTGDFNLEASSIQENSLTTNVKPEDEISGFNTER